MVNMRAIFIIPDHRKQSPGPGRQGTWRRQKAADAWEALAPTGHGVREGLHPTLRCAACWGHPSGCPSFLVGIRAQPRSPV